MDLSTLPSHLTTAPGRFAAGHEITDNTLIVAERFRLVERL